MSVKNEIIIKRADGSKVKLTVSLGIDFLGPVSWGISAYVCEPNKRTFLNVLDTDDYAYRRLNPKERNEFHAVKIKEVVSDDEILAAKVSLWESIKPS